jgi:hypothetical protein
MLVHWSKPIMRVGGGICNVCDTARSASVYKNNWWGLDEGVSAAGNRRRRICEAILFQLLQKIKRHGQTQIIGARFDVVLTQVTIT